MAFRETGNRFMREAVASDEGPSAVPGLPVLQGRVRADETGVTVMADETKNDYILTSDVPAFLAEQGIVPVS